MKFYKVIVQELFDNDYKAHMRTVGFALTLRGAKKLFEKWFEELNSRYASCLNIVYITKVRMGKVDDQMDIVAFNSISSDCEEYENEMWYAHNFSGWLKPNYR